MCERAIDKYSLVLEFVPDQYKVQEMCNKALKKGPCFLIHVPDWFVTQDQVKTWHEDDCYCNDDEIVEWYNEYKKHKAQKAEIKEASMPIAWHPSRCWDWGIPEDKKERIKELFTS